MNERVSKESAMVEYRLPLKHRVSKESAMVEYRLPLKHRVSNVAIMVEYVVIPATGRVLGPALQVV